MANRYVWKKYNRLETINTTYNSNDSGKQNISSTSTTSKTIISSWDESTFYRIGCLGTINEPEYIVSFSSSSGKYTIDRGDGTKISTSEGLGNSTNATFGTIQAYSPGNLILVNSDFTKVAWVAGYGSAIISNDALLVSAKYYSDYLSETVLLYRTWVSTAKTTTTYSKGSTSYGNISAASSGSYPSNSYSGSYWYVYQGYDCIDPSAISYSAETPRGGETIDITITPRANTYGGTIKYKYEYSLDGGTTWITANSGTTSTAVSVLIPVGSTQFTARVTASDNMGFTSSTAVSGAALTVTNNTAPVITCAVAALGDITAAFTVPYSVSDTDGNTMTITEKLDETLLRSYTTADGEETLTVDADRLLRTLNGEHVLTITADDGNGGVATHSISFTKAVYACSISLLEPLEADDRIALMVMHVVGQIPSDAIYTVEVTNNAYDESPVWEDITNYIENGWNYSFVNTVCTAGQWGFNFRITVQRGESGVGGYITSIDGGFEGE